MTTAKKFGRTVLKSTGKGTGYIPDLPNHAQDLRLAKRLGDAIKAAVPENPTLEPQFFPRIRDQGELGSCVGHGVRSGLMYHLVKRDKKLWSKLDLSPLALYYWARTYIKMERVDSGAYIRDGIKGAANYGGSREDHWPYDVNKFTRTPSKLAQTSGKWHQAVRYYRCDEVGQSPETTINNILRAVSNGLPVVFGFPCYNNLGQADGNGYIPNPDPGSSTEDGHCMCIYGADTGSRVFFGPNSWSEGWGGVAPGAESRGYYFLPFDYFSRGDADDAWAVDHEQ